MDVTYFKSPVGWLRISANDKGLTAVEFVRRASAQGKPIRNTHLRMAVNQLKEYFTGRRKSFDVPLSEEFQDPSFSKKVWRQLAEIPFGRTQSYGEIASAVREPRAARAVGGACGRNRFLILIPCHRVIASDGSLGGFALDLNIKRQLLNHERRVLEHR